MLNLFYTIAFVFSFVCLFVLFTQFQNKVTVYYVMLFSAIMLTNFGYLLLTRSGNLEMALFSNQVLYLGASFTPFFFFMCLANLCKTKIHPWIQTGMVILGCFIFFLVCNYGVDNWGPFSIGHIYYKNLYIVKKYGVNFLQKDYGPLHTIYPLYFILTAISELFMIIRSFKAKLEVSVATGVTLLITMLFTIVFYIIEKLVVKIPLIPFSYFFTEIFLLFLLQRIKYYNVDVISKDFISIAEVNGFFMCDNKGAFLGSDEVARKWFPEIGELKIDKHIKHSLLKKSELLNQIDYWVHCGEISESKGNKKILISQVVDGQQKYFEVEHFWYVENKRRMLHFISIYDDTQDQLDRQYKDQINQQLEIDVKSKSNKMRQAQRDLLVGLASIIENRDSNTGGHVQRTSDVMKIFVRHLESTGKFPFLDNQTSSRIIRSAPMHDLGKVGVADIILKKPGKFTDEEYLEMQTHAEKGAKIVQKLLSHYEDDLFRKIAVNVAHFHHEKWNGKGYPSQLSGIDIPFEARVMALADVFDALVSKRVYKSRMSYDQAFEIIRKDSGSHFDPDLSVEFIQCREKLEALYNSYDDDFDKV